MQVTLLNQGPAIPDEHLEHIFEKFYTFPGMRQVSSTGLGLSICKGIVEAHGGRIWAANHPDGLAFCFTLPLSKVDLFICGCSFRDEGTSRRQRMSSQPTILVIDDEQQILRAMRTILGQHNYRVITASTGAEGLALATTSMPDVIILDLGLPDMEGAEVCAQLRAWTLTPIIVLSVRDSDTDKVFALDQGADDYLTKPFSVDELLARVRVALRHRSLVQGSKSTIVQAGDVSIDLANHIVTRKGEDIKLSATEFKLLAYLASNAGTGAYLPGNFGQRLGICGSQPDGISAGLYPPVAQENWKKIRANLV